VRLREGTLGLGRLVKVEYNGISPAAKNYQLVINTPADNYKFFQDEGCRPGERLKLEKGV